MGTIDLRRRRVRSVDAKPLPLIEAEGYLTGHADDHEQAFDLEGIEALERRPHVVILGESGIGKSQVLMELWTRAQAAGHRTAMVELATVSGVIDLVDQVHELRASPDSSPTLFLDNLEHCPVAADIEKVIAAALARLPVKPRLRMAVRAGAWRPALRDRLAAVWQVRDLHVSDLLPLTRRDVVTTFESLVRDAQSTVSRLEASGAAPLMAVPVTLLMLLAEAASAEPSGPLDRRGLYARAMRRLADHQQAVRDDQRDPDERLAIARRIAAVTVLGMRSGIRTEHSVPGPGQNAVVALRELVNGQPEPIDKQRWSRVLESLDVSDVLCNTGLFARVQPNEVTWRHASFADYLAAEYLELHELTVEQVQSLVAVGHDVNIPLALEGLVGWLALASDRFFDLLLAQNPMALLRVGASSLSDDKRARLVDALFAALVDARIGRFNEDGRTSRVRGLAHPGLADQIRKYVRTPPSERALSEIISVAARCGTKELADELAAVALDPSRPMQVRDEAAHAVASLDVATASQALRPLLDDPADADDQLLGSALAALWPRWISADEVFAALHPPKVPSLIGSYWAFLRTLANDLRAEHLPASLRWAAQQSADGAWGWHTGLVDRIVNLALAQPEIDRWMPSIVAIFTARASGRGRLLDADRLSGPEPSVSEAVRRRLLLAAAADEPSKLLTRAPFTEPPLLYPHHDLPWIVAELESAPTDRALLAILGRSLAMSPFHVAAETLSSLRALADRNKGIKALEAMFSANRAQYFARERPDRPAVPASIDRATRHAQQVRGRALAFLDGDSSVIPALAAQGLPSEDNQRWKELSATELQALVGAAVGWLEQWARQAPTVSAESIRWALKLVRDREQLGRLSASVWRALVSGGDRPFGHVPSNAGTAIGAKLEEHAGDAVLAALCRVDLAALPSLAHGLGDLFEKPWRPALAAAVAEVATRLCGPAVLPLLHELFESTPSLAEPIAWRLAEATSDESRIEALTLLFRFGSADARTRVFAGVFTSPSADGLAVVAKLAESVY